MHRRLVAILVLAVAAGTISVGTAHARTRIGRCLRSRIDGAREAQGLQGLDPVGELRKKARTHSRRMARRHLLLEVDVAALQAPGSLGGIVAVGRSCRQAYDALAARAPGVMEDPAWNQVGVGAARTGHRSWVTVILGDVPPPARPEALSAEPDAPPRVRLAWADVADESGYVVERSVDGGGGWSEVATISADDTDYTDDGLAEGVTYRYRVSAVGLGGESDPSDEAAATTPDGGPTGTVVDIPSSIAADCSAPVEQEVMDWIASVPDGATARFALNGCYGFDGTIEVPDRTDLTINGNGATFRALTQGTPGRDAWRIEGGQGITLKNMTVRGANPAAGTSDGAYVNALEWQHGFDFQGTRGGTLSNVRVFDIYGDFVEAMWDQRVPNIDQAPISRNIEVKNSRFERNGRMGFGLTGVDGFVLRDSYVGDVRWNAIDIELDVESHSGQNIEILGNTFGPVRFSVLANEGVGGDPRVGTVTVSGNTMLGPVLTCQPPVFVRAPAGVYRSGWTVEDNAFRTIGDGISMRGAKDVSIRRNSIVRETWGGCTGDAGVHLEDVHRVTVTDNAFTGAGAVLSVDTLSTGVTESGNSL